MSGLVGIPAQETARFSDFARSLAGTDFPEGWEVRFRFGHDIADNTNALISEMLELGKDWFWYMGDDHAWSPSLLRKLLSHGKDIVVPLCLMRNAPYRPVIWKEKPQLEEAILLFGDERYERVELSGHPDGGLIEVAAAGGAGMLIHRGVFEEIGEPWFEAGRGSTARVGEDINFCEKARAHGFDIHCDLDSVLGHCATTVVWPVHEPDGWTFGFSMMGGFQVTMPPGMQAYADGCGR